ncbi:MAG: alpha-amylase family glycosyl hydrolase [Anaerolineae bacterium]|nr:alpha-amylase family glycosyl hydrolase [Anaerolineae bacterium]
MTSQTSELLWWQRGVIYQIYPRSFMDANGDGIGDLRGVIQKIDYLAQTLGVDAIWLSPFYPSPMADFGYDVADYCDVDPIFGTLADFDELLATAHARGLKVIVDLVPNHTSDQHPWFKESRSSRNNPKRNWYVWADPKPDGSPPNNWLSVFGGSAWEFDPQTGQYYLHSFLKEQPDLNWRNPEVKAAMFDVMRFWLRRGVDGFRVDVAHFLMKDPELRDNPLSQGGLALYKPMGDYDSQIHLYDKGHPDNHALYREFRAVLDEFEAISPRMAVGEIHIPNWEEWASYYGQNNDELHMPFNFAFINAPWRADVVREVVENVERVLSRGQQPNYVFGNHDEPRIASRIGEQAARACMMLLLTLRGTPTMYYGDEIGMVNGEIPPELAQDPWGKRVQGLGLGRDPERTPMQWDASPNAGFSPVGVQTWLPVNPDYPRRNVAAQLADPRSMLNLTRALLKLRRQSPALHGGAYRTLSSDAHTYVFERAAGDQRFAIAINFTAEPHEVALPSRGVLVLSTEMDRADEPTVERLMLRPHEGVIVRL